MKRLYNFLSGCEKRRLRSRKRLNKGLGYLRISIFKSNKHFYAQLINDVEGVTLASASTLDPKIRELCQGKVNSESIKKVSSLMVERLSNVDLKNKQLVFDRGAYKYNTREEFNGDKKQKMGTGLIAQFADALRNSGFKF